MIVVLEYNKQTTANSNTDFRELEYRDVCMQLLKLQPLRSAATLGILCCIGITISFDFCDTTLSCLHISIFGSLQGTKLSAGLGTLLELIMLDTPTN